MGKAKHTPGPWHRNIRPASKYPTIFAGRNTHVADVASRGLPEAEIEANCNLITAAPLMLEALRLHMAWADSERAGPDYGGQTRDTHPDGEKIWSAWWGNQLDLCGRANSATAAAIAKAEGDRR